MAYARTNFIYNAAKVRMTNSTFSWSAAKRLLLFTDAAAADPNPAHTTVGEIGTPAYSLLLPNKSVGADGYVKSGGVMFENISGADIVAIVIAEDATPVANGLLVAHYSDVEFLPFLPDNKDWFVTPNVLGWFVP